MLKDPRIQNLHKQLKRARWIGGGILVLGLVNLLDSHTPFPIPLTGTPAWLTSIALIIIGSIWFYQYFKPREDEIVLLATMHTDGYLTVAVVHELLGIPVRTIAKTLLDMYKEGIIIRVSDPEIKNVYECVFRVPNIEKENHAPTPPALPRVNSAEINQRFLEDIDRENEKK
ncbi:MAG: hypothetical protein PVH61_06510 [Candidatus Aminicenantes bacterium]